MKFAALLLLFALVGKMSAAPGPYRFAYYRAAAPAPQQQQLDVEEDSDETEISQEDFSQDGIRQEIQDDDDDDSDEEPPPAFHKLFPLPQRNSPGHNVPLSAMMSEVAIGGWNVPKAPVRKNQVRGRNAIEIARDDDESGEDSDEDEDEEEDDEPEDDLPDWQNLFPNLQDEGQGPPEGVVDTSSQPEIPAAYRSAMGGNRIVYIPSSQVRRSRPVPRQYVMRSPAPQRTQVMYGMMPNRRQQSRPQYVMASPSMYNRQQYVMASSPSMYNRRPQYAVASPQRRPQQGVYYMPVRRNNYSPYVNTPRYRYY